MSEPRGIDQIMASEAQDREKLLATIAAEDEARAKSRAKSARWAVVRQFNHLPEQQMCTHRWEWAADLCARWRTVQHRHETGAYYVSRRAER